MCDMARRSVLLNNLEEKMEIINCNFKNLYSIFDSNSLDCIVSNPPYKKANSGVLNQNLSKLISRHEIECTLDDIISTSSKLLKNSGEFYIVHRPERLSDIINCLCKYNLEPKVLRFVHSNSNSEPKLILIKAVKNGKSFLKVEKPLYIYDDTGNYSNEVLKIYNKI